MKKMYKVIKSISKAFNLNPEWLKHGKGKVHLEPSTEKKPVEGLKSYKIKI